MTSEYTPVRITTDRPPVEQERITLFWIDDTEYTAPAKVSAATALRALQIVADHGTTVAAYRTMIECIGQDAYDALTACPQLTFDDARSIISKITDLYFGQALELAGK